MKSLRFTLWLCFSLAVSSCFLKDEVLPDCEVQNTAQVYFINNSSTGKTYDILWDGVNVATISPGQESSTITTTAGIPHSMTFRVAGTTTLACSTSNPSIPQCKKMSYSCSG